MAVTLFESILHRYEGSISVVAYISASLYMTMSTKYLTNTFPSMSTLLLFECALTSIILFMLFPRRFHPLRPDILRHVFPVTLAKAGNMFLSFIAIKNVSLPVYNVLKRLNPVFSLLADFILRGSRTSLMTVCGIMLIGTGAVVTGAGDFDFDLIAYFVGVVAAMLQASYLVLSRRAQDKIPSLNHVDLLFYTACYNMLVFLPKSLVEIPKVMSFLETVELNTLAVLASYLFMGAALNYVTFWCTSVNSPLTTGVAGNVKGLLSTILGIIQYGARLASLGYLGLLISSSGGVVYSISRARAKKGEESKKKKKKEEMKEF